MPKSKPCVCGHQHDAHEHYRRGTDCAICGAEVCPKYRASRARSVDPLDDAPAKTPERAKRHAFSALRLISS